MKLNLNGVEIDLPNNAKVDVSQDGKHVKIELPEAKVVEKIRVVEREASPVVERTEWTAGENRRMAVSPDRG